MQPQIVAATSHVHARSQQGEACFRIHARNRKKRTRVHVFTALRQQATSARSMGPTPARHATRVIGSGLQLCIRMITATAVTAATLHLQPYSAINTQTAMRVDCKLCHRARRLRIQNAVVKTVVNVIMELKPQRQPARSTSIISVQDATTITG